MRGVAGVVGAGLLAVALALTGSARASTPESAARCALPQAPGLDSGVHLQGDFDYLMLPRGRARALILQVDFEDAPGTADPGQEVDAAAASGPWYRAASHGEFALEVDGVRRWLRMPEPKGAYTGTSTKLVTHAIRAADPDVDFSDVDIVLAAMPPGSGMVALAGALRQGDGIVADGKEIRHFARIYSGAWSTAAHEMAHTFGLIDLYSSEPGGPPKHVGVWDLMSLNKRHGFFAWHKWKLGWLDPGQIDCVTQAGVTEHTLAPLAADGGTKAVAIRTGEHSAIVAENRQPGGHDDGLCNYGVLVYRVDTTVGWGQGPIKVLPAKEDTDRNTCGRLHNAPYNAGDVATFHDPGAGVAIEAVGSAADGYRVRVGSARSYEPPPFAAAVRVGLRLRRHLRAIVTAWSVVAECRTGKVTVQRKRGSRHRTAGRVAVKASGKGRKRLRDRAGRYRAVAPERSAGGAVCAEATSDYVRHRHKRKRKR